jgi:4-amino-4-deoxy-L-arabinose transferase-like glycosyltransferase
MTGGLGSSACLPGVPGIGRLSILLAWVLSLAFLVYRVNSGHFEAGGGIVVVEIGLLALIVLVGLFLALRGRLSYPGATSMVLLVGVILRLGYFFVSPPELRQHDLEMEWGHLHYIKYVAEEFRLPPSVLNQAYHPPLHHIFSALLLNAGRFFDFGEVMSLRFVQMAMVWASCLGMVVVHRILVVAGCGQRATLFGVSFFALFPYGIYESVYLNNDNLLLLLYLAALLNLLRWQRDRSWRSILLFGLFLSLGLVTKKSALLLLPTFGLVFLASLLADSGRWRRFLLQGVVFLLVAVPLPLAVHLRSMGVFGMGFTWVPVPGIAQFGAFGKGLREVFSLPLRTFLDHPYTGDLFTDNARNGFLTEYLLKSALFGEWGFPGLEGIATLLLACGATLVAVTGVSMVVRWREWISPAGVVLLLNLLIVYAAVVKFRIDYPYMCSQNFRYLMPGLVSAAFFVGMMAGGGEGRRSPVRRWLLPSLVVLFSGTSALFVALVGA